ncbi:MAG: threonine/serine dehydratase [Gemmatimonadota bacterium]
MTHHPPAALSVPPTLPAISDALARLAPYVRATPIWEWRDSVVARRVGAATEVVLKLELLQQSGTFKARGALTVMLNLSATELDRGVTAVSAGNHAAAVAFAAHTLGSTAKVVMPKTANPARIAICRDYGAEVVLAENVHEAFDLVKAIEASEGRTFVHPFEGPLTALGTATLGLELLRQADDLEAVVVPVGGGGLIAGVAAAVKQVNPRCVVYGVEPEGNDTIKRSVASGRPEQAGGGKTIADSLSPPYALPYSLSLIERFVDDIVLVSDDALREAMYVLFSRMKLAVEPAGAATTAAIMGPLAARLAGKRTGLIVCGANIDPATFATNVTRGAELWAERRSSS